MDGTSKLLQNLAALVVLPLLVFWMIDWVAGMIGYQTSVLCWGLGPLMQVTYLVGYGITLIGVVIWAFSYFRNASMLLLALGGFFLSALPHVLHHFPGVSCRTSPALTAMALQFAFS